MKSRRYLLTGIVLLLTPLVAFANAGTALMWASGLHFLFGNAILGFIEGQLVSRFFNTLRVKAVAALISFFIQTWVIKLRKLRLSRHLLTLPQLIPE